MAAEELDRAFTREEVLSIRDTLAQRRAEAGKNAEAFRSIGHAIRSTAFPELFLLPLVDGGVYLIPPHPLIAELSEHPHKPRPEVAADELAPPAAFEEVKGDLIEGGVVSADNRCVVGDVSERPVLEI
jgi:hypothetical protein